jgi:hypothetical protein
MKQYNIWGGEDEVKPRVEKRGRPKLKTMQESYGTYAGHTCKECQHCLKLDYHDYSYYKCEKWIISHSSATDIRLKNKACNMFMKEGENGSIL